MIPNDEIRALLDQAPSKVDIHDLERAERACDAAIAAAEAAVGELHRKLDEMGKSLIEAQRDRENITSYRAFVLRFRGLPASDIAAEAETEAEDEDETTPPEEPHRSASGRGVKRTAIVEYLADEAVRHRDEIREALIAKGIMGEGEAETHTLNVTLSRMYRNDELERPRKGFYKRPSATPDETSPDNAQEVLGA